MSKADPLIAAHARWVQLLEAIHAPAPDDRAWVRPILDEVRAILPGASKVGF